MGRQILDLELCAAVTKVVLRLENKKICELIEEIVDFEIYIDA